MKYLMTSDIHGSLGSLKRVLDFFDREACDMMCLLGDVLNYGPRNGLPADLAPREIADELNGMADKIVAVRGNCDSEVDQMLLHFPIMADYSLLVEGGKRIFLTHGHVFGENNMPPLGIDAFVYGHTHLWKLEADSKGRVVCNLGSPTFPKGGNPPTFATLEDGIFKVWDISRSRPALLSELAL